MWHLTCYTCVELTEVYCKSQIEDLKKISQNSLACIYTPIFTKFQICFTYKCIYIDNGLFDTLNVCGCK